MNPLDRLDELFLRYWDDALTGAEADELAGLLRDAPAARARFTQLCADTVALTERHAVIPPAPSPSRPPRRVRRRVLAGAGLAVLAASVALVLWLPPAGQSGAVPVLAQSTGAFVVRGGVRQPAAAGLRVAPGETIITPGLETAAQLAYPDGSAVVLSGSTTAAVDLTTPGRLEVLSGGVSVTIPAAATGLRLATPEAEAALTGGANATVQRVVGRTDVGVWAGRVRMTDAGGGAVDVGRGEWASAAVGRVVRKEAFDSPPDRYEWDLTRPLPGDWLAGRLRPDRDRPAVWADPWDDPYLHRQTFQVRTDNAWTRGLAQLYPDSVIRFRFAVDRPGKGQLIIVARPDPPVGPTAAVFEAPEVFRRARPGVWETREFRVGDLRTPKGPVAFGPPWVMYKVAFNTFEDDLGLRVAEFRVVRPTPD